MTLQPERLARIRDTDPELFAALVDRIAEQEELETEPPYVTGLFSEQREFYLDPAPLKAALCSRRAGKTFGVGAWLLDGARDDPDGLSVYICLSRNQARLILWATLQSMNRSMKLGLKFREIDNQLNVVCPNGHTIWLVGCKDSVEMEKFRGLKLRRAAIDEAASFGEYIRPLVFDVLQPALLDLQGELVLIGTPGVVPAGLFFEITTGEGMGEDAAAAWSTHSWTVLDNPHIPHAAAWLADKRKQNRWEISHPRYQREWLGLWVRDEGALCYPIDPKRNYYYRLPGGDEVWTYAIGVDVGYEDSTAFIVGAFRRNHPEIYIVHAIKYEHLIPSAVAARLLALKKRYSAYQIVMDTGGIGKGYAEECSQRYGIFIEPAKKTQKRAYMEIVRGELISGNIKVHPADAQCLVIECASLVWDEKGEMPDERFEDHAADGFTYLVRALLPYYRPKLVAEILTPRQQADKEQKEERQRASKQVQMGLRRKMRNGSVLADIANGY